MNLCKGVPYRAAMCGFDVAILCQNAADKPAFQVTRKQVVLFYIGERSVEAAPLSSKIQSRLADPRTDWGLALGQLNCGGEG